MQQSIPQLRRGSSRWKEGIYIYIYARMQLAKLVVTDCIQKNFNFKPITE